MFAFQNKKYLYKQTWKVDFWTQCCAFNVEENFSTAFLFESIVTDWFKQSRQKLL